MTPLKKTGSQIESFGYAYSGLIDLIKTQNHFRFHILGGAAVTAAGLFFKISLTDWSILALTFMAVLIAEALNTAIEYSLDALHPEFHPLIKRAKDIAAGAVLISAIGSIIVGIIIFVPYF